jgi:RND family efflux transporter MFP subunit
MMVPVLRHPLSCLALVAGLALAGCGGGAASSDAKAMVAPVQTGAVTSATWRPTVELTGSLDPVAAVQLGFDVPGRIEAVLVSRGDRVERGQALARLDDTVAQAQLQQSQGARSAAEAQAEAARIGLGRLQQLGDGASAQRLTEIEAQVKGAEGQLAQATAAVSLTQAQLRFHTLKAPIDGVVTTGPDNPGALTGAGSPLFTIEDVSGLRLKGTVPEEHAWVADGAEVVLYPGVPGVTEGVPGRVERVLPSLDASNRRLPVEIRVDDPPASLKAHGFVRARLTGTTDQPVWSVPPGTVVARPEFAVFLLDDPTKPVKVPVVLLEESSERVLVQGALHEGAKVVVNPPRGYGE